MCAQPFYHLRPNKYIDRQLFISLLKKLSFHFNIKNYNYVGFGSYLFDDFKLVHNNFDIEKMTSLECNDTLIKRAKFNKPLNCIKIVNQKSSEFIEEFNHEDKNYIFWLDYTDPSSLGEQFSDFCSLLNQLQNGDVLRITLNANPSSLGGTAGEKADILRRERLENLKSKIDPYLPTDVCPDNLTTSQYPKVLLKALEFGAYSTLVEGFFQERFPVIIDSSVYADGQQMVTLTLIVLDNHTMENKILESVFSDLYSNYSDLEETKKLLLDKPKTISIPDLTTKEIMYINSKIPTEQAAKKLARRLSFVFEDVENTQNYLDYYRIYPYFREVSF